MTDPLRQLRDPALLRVDGFINGIWTPGAAAECPEVPVVQSSGLLTRAVRAIPLKDRRLSLTEDLFADEAVCILDARSRRVCIRAPGRAEIGVEADGFAHWAFWKPREAPFVCIESWTGNGDYDGYDGELADRPSTLRLASGSTAHHRLKYASAEDVLLSVGRLPVAFRSY